MNSEALTMKMSRRTMLRGMGVSLALPWLESAASARTLIAAPPRRALWICTPLGLHAPNFFPTRTGKDYEPTAYLEVLKDYRGDFTVISGLSHPGVDAGHESINSFLTSAPHPEERSGFRNAISVDQLAAEQIGDDTRFASLTLSDTGIGLSWTRSGAPVPADVFPASVFARLFIDGKPDEVQQQLRRLRDGQSILDTVGGQARKVQSGLGPGDRDKLDEYFTSVRELEQRLTKAEEWSKKPKPKVNAKPPQNIVNRADLIGRTRLMFDLVHLALQTDSTRLITMVLGGANLVPPIPGVSIDHHTLSHHGQDAEKLAQLKIVETETMKAFHDLLAKLKGAKEETATLLDHTMVMLGSNLGNGNSHSCKNLPILLAGGGFKHGQHLAFGEKNAPLANLFVSMLQRLGIETERFGSSDGPLKGLEKS